ncbi:MAG TPA: DUF1343 domain-containing protein, partial [Alphaproteobacteria bacterium]|nr:DUF1343 domain-containing protein [Alphaproteobacteria bacterium]
MIRSSPRESQAQNAPRGKSRRSRCNEAAGGAFPATLGGRIAVLANQASRDAALRPIWAALPARPVRLFAPEHGVLGALQAGEADHDGTDPITGAPVVALYGARSAPEPGHLADLDAVVVDLVDTGVRSYTYAATLYAVQRAAAAAGVPVVVLDRPNPLGRRREGGGVAPGHGSFVAKLDVPLRHGLTLGELARLNAATQGLPAPQVVPHWERSLPAVWVAPSPNIPTPAAALAYAGTVLIEGTALSEGRGTTRPFTTIGAPGLEAEALAAALAGEPGALVQSLWFTPVAS